MKVILGISYGSCDRRSALGGACLRRSGFGFTLIELLVVMGMLTLLVGILLPSLSGARKQAASTMCQSNIRQIAVANGYYAQESRGVYVPGASHFLMNLHRWHGQREKIDAPFDSSRGLLVPYLGEGDGIRACPSFSPERIGFEAGNGGYGYNNAYIGVETIAKADGRAIVASDLRGAWADRIKRPADTVMFADTAFARDVLIEYSFAEPRYHPQYGRRADPSIHFLHKKTANIAWCDSHVTRETRTFTWSSGFYAGDPDRHNIGWFGRTDDNRVFDLR